MFEKRKAELKSDGRWVGKKRLIQFSYGNTHALVEDDEGIGKHRWTMFVIFSEDKFATDQYI